MHTGKLVLVSLTKSAVFWATLLLSLGVTFVIVLVILKHDSLLTGDDAFSVTELVMVYVIHGVLLLYAVRKLFYEIQEQKSRARGRCAQEKRQNIRPHDLLPTSNWARVIPGELALDGDVSGEEVEIVRMFNHVVSLFNGNQTKRQIDEAVTAMSDAVDASRLQGELVLRYTKLNKQLAQLAEFLNRGDEVFDKEISPLLLWLTAEEDRLSVLEIPASSPEFVVETMDRVYCRNNKGYASVLNENEINIPWQESSDGTTRRWYFFSEDLPSMTAAYDFACVPPEDRKRLQITNHTTELEKLNESSFSLTSVDSAQAGVDKIQLLDYEVLDKKECYPDYIDHGYYNAEEIMITESLTFYVKPDDFEMVKTWAEEVASRMPKATLSVGWE